MAASGDDAIGAAQAHLAAYAKLVADTVWEVQQMRAEQPTRVRLSAQRLCHLH
jgi:hypothetical protein